MKMNNATKTVLHWMNETRTGTDAALAERFLAKQFPEAGPVLVPETEVFTLASLRRA
jgi:hypothetical protein